MKCFRLNVPLQYIPAFIYRVGGPNVRSVSPSSGLPTVPRNALVFNYNADRR